MLCQLFINSKFMELRSYSLIWDILRVLCNSEVSDYLDADQFHYWRFKLKSVLMQYLHRGLMKRLIFYER